MKMTETGGVIQSERMTPLLSFKTIFDIDYGLINLVKSEYLDRTIFDESYFKDKNMKDIVVDLYGREDVNPLYQIAKNDVDKNLLDSLYGEFLLKQEDNIYAHSITTSVLNMINSFVSSQTIKPNILCYNDIQVKYVKDEPKLEKCPIIMSTELCSDERINIFDQYFFKSVDEVNIILKYVKAKTIYFSSYSCNMKENDLINPEIINQLIKNKNKISIFDMYNSYMLGGV